MINITKHYHVQHYVKVQSYSIINNGIRQIIYLYIGLVLII